MAEATRVLRPILELGPVRHLERDLVPRPSPGVELSKIYDYLADNVSISSLSDMVFAVNEKRLRN